MKDFGPARPLVDELKKALFVGQEWDVSNHSDGFAWMGRSQSRVVAINVVGDPVREVAISVPPGGRASGEVLGAFLERFAPGSRPWAVQELRRWGRRGPRSKLDKRIERAGVVVRIQGRWPLLVVTVAC